MKIAGYFAIVTGICACLHGKAQSPRQFYSIQSPNSATLKGSIESPVSLNTGKAGVSIPLYTIQQKDIKVPIALSYNSNGVKPDMHPGWVGLNWGLQTGGVITRNIKGIPDELYWRSDFALTIDGDNQGSVTVPYGYFYNYPVNASANWDSNQQITNLAKAGMEPNTAWVEAEPDEFVFECGEYSGKFFMDHNGFIRVQGRPDIKVEGEIIYNVPLFDATKPLDVNDPSTFTSVDIAFYVSGPGGGQYPVYRFSRIRKAILMGFKITTPDGLQYEFGMWGKPYSNTDTFDEVEFTSDMFGQFLFDEIFTTWHLTKITAPNNEFVEYIYERGHPVMQMGRNFSFYKAGGSAPAKGFLGFLFGDVSASTSEAKEELSGRFIRPTYLKRIETNLSTIEFITSVTNELKYNYAAITWEILDRSRFYDTDYLAPGFFSRLMLGIQYPNPNPLAYPPGIVDWGNNEYTIFRHDGLVEDLYFNNLKWYKLDKVKITSKSTNTVLAEWNFTYNNVSNERLQLLSLQETGKNGTSLPPYVFEYDQSKTLPSYNAFLIDHWGYFNNRLAQVNINDNASLDNYKNLREPVAEFLYAGSLVKVTSPAGGVKQFVYEPNKYKAIVTRNTDTGSFSVSQLGTEKIGGGLRIKQVIDKFGAGSPDVTTTYTYGDGLLMGDVQYYWPTYNGRLLNGNVYTSTRFVTESLLPVSENPGGGAVTYEQVTETKTGNGRTVHLFTGFTASPDVHGTSIDAQKTPYSPFTSRGFERGLPKEIQQYDESGTMLLSETYDYLANPGFSSDFIRAVNSRGIAMFGATQVNVIEGTAYKHFLHPFQNIRKTTKVLDKTSGIFQTTIQDFAYDTDPSPNNDNQLKQVKQINSAGDEQVINYKHPLDFQVNDGVAELTGINALKTSRIWKQVLTEETLTKRVGESQYLISAYLLNTFTKTTQGFPVADAIYRLGISSPVSSHSTVIGPSALTLDSRMIKEVTFNKYDNLGNLQQFTPLDGVPVTLLYGYRQSYPVAEIKNTSYQTVLGVLGQTAIDQLNALNPGTDAQVRTQLQPLRSATALSSALLTTYTYSPLTGMTSTTDPNNITTYYEYDNLGRLKLIKDHNQHVVKMVEYNYKIR